MKQSCAHIAARAFVASISTLLSAISLAPSAHAETPALLNEVALFYRCHAHFSQTRPALNDPRLAAVKAGTKTAVQACTELLDSAKFTTGSGTKIADDNDTLAKSVLNSFHQLHRSWSREQQLFNSDDSRTLQASQTWYEDNPYGAYVTRALFGPSVTVESVVEGAPFLQPVRATMTPVPAMQNVPNYVEGEERDFRLGSQHPFAPRGDLLGIRSFSVPPVTYFDASRLGPTPTPLPNVTPTPYPRFFGNNLTTMPDFDNIGVPPAGTQAISVVSFPDVSTLKGPLDEIDYFAIRIQGQITIPTTGSYTLYLDVDDAGSLFIDHTRVLDRNGSGEGSVTKTLSAGSHALMIHFRQRAGAGRLNLRWQGPGISKQIVPSSNLSGLVGEYYTHGRPPPLEFTGNLGGGFIGNQNYLITTFAEADKSFIPNGQEKTNRSWARAVLKDTLCREAPVVRESDVTSFVVPDSETPFRQAAGCTSCHASLDRQAGVIRGLRWNVLTSPGQASPYPDLYGILGVSMMTPSFPEATAWGDQLDPDYAGRSPHGHFFFRNFRGELIDQEIRSLDELASVIKQQDDFYTCFAKRYYYYLLGIDVNLGDPGDPSYPQPNAPDAYHRQQVIDLGMQLKSHHSLRQLLIDMISLDEYRMTDFGIGYAGPN